MLHVAAGERNLGHSICQSIKRQQHEYSSLSQALPRQCPHCTASKHDNALLSSASTKFARLISTSETDLGIRERRDCRPLWARVMLRVAGHSRQGPDFNTSLVFNLHI